VPHDGDDPYLVVAADKAPPPSPTSPMRWAQEYGYWLDDAFARRLGGLRPQEDGHHCRGAWES